jgi:ATP-dependent Clp endopeptidase proteolytic subunit ClpP
MNEVFHPGMKRSWFNLAYEKDGETASAYIYDDIGLYGVMAKDFIEEVNTSGPKNLNVYINSYGGEIDEGVAIYNFLNRFPGNVTIRVDGMAASIASIIAMAGDTVIMPKSSLMFIHNPWTMAAGDADQLQREAANLEKRKASLMAIYADKTGLPAEQLSQIMDDETLLNAEEAVALGFADMIEDAPAVASAYNATLYNKVLCAMAKKMKTEEMHMDAEIKPVNQEPEEVKDVELTPDSKTDDVDTEAKAETCPNCGKEVVAMEDDKEEEMKAEEMPKADEPIVYEKKEEYDARAEFKSFVDSFGPERAANYFSAGYSMVEAKAAYLGELEKENADLKARVASETVKPVASKPSDASDSPTTFTREQVRRMSAEDYRKNRSAINKAQAEGRIK